MNYAPDIHIPALLPVAGAASVVGAAGLEAPLGTGRGVPPVGCGVPDVGLPSRLLRLLSLVPMVPPGHWHVSLALLSRLTTP